MFITGYLGRVFFSPVPRAADLLKKESYSTFHFHESGPKNLNMLVYSDLHVCKDNFLIFLDLVKSLCFIFVVAIFL